MYSGIPLESNAGVAMVQEFVCLVLYVQMLVVSLVRLIQKTKTGDSLEPWERYPSQQATQGDQFEWV